jgi:hypothetical protein
MTFKSPLWYPAAILLTAINLVGVGFAAASTEAWHAGVHATLALAFGLWAQRLRQRRGVGGSEVEARLQSLEADMARLESLEADVSKLRQELGEAHERLDFAERMLAQGKDKPRVGPT